ncbi:MAG: GspH/FimT family protein [Clostridia bacterium]|nr:GspH/FimT family protein [Clostridia bacterium]MDD4047768.1 GspH/FimT family protein [Clostridia bacterium]
MFNNKGFTFLEIIITLVIIGIISAITIPAVSAVIEKKELQVTAKSMVSLFRYAQEEAVSAEAQAIITFCKDTPDYYAIEIKREDIILEQKLQKFSKGIELFRTDFPRNSFIFDESGAPSEGGQVIIGILGNESMKSNIHVSSGSGRVYIEEGY